MLPYEYQPLNPELHQIRLLHMHPGMFDDDLYGSLVICALPPRQRPVNPYSDFDWAIIKEVIPAGWEPMETLGGRILLDRWDPGYTTAWLDPELEAQARVVPSYGTEGAAVKPIFEALSYTWGSKEYPCSIQITDEGNGLPPRRLDITKNLAKAFQHLRYEDYPRVLWVDAVCINQRDDKEKGHQVAGMARIYELASKVVVWLGPADPHNESQLAMATLDYLGRQVVVSRGIMKTRAPNCKEKRWYLNTSPLPYDERQWASIKSLLSRTWFTRLWVWQEIQLASAQSVVKCGRDEVPWTTFRQAVICLQDKRSIPDSTRTALVKSPRMMFDNRDVTLGYMLAAVIDSSCANPRDKVYGILGLVGDSMPADWRPSYGLSVSDAFRDVLLNSAKHTKSLKLLRFCISSGARPSWVPDWYERDLARRQYWAPWVQPERYNASADVEASFNELDCGILEVESVSKCTVATVNEATLVVLADSVVERGALARTVQSWVPDGLPKCSYCTGGSLYDAFVLTLCDDRTKEAYPNLNFPLLSKYRSAVQRLLEPSDKVLEESEDPAWTGDVEGVDFIWNSIRNRRYFTSKQGHIGLSPTTILPDDEVHVLLGCNAPMILRPTPDGYKVVGEAYVHGLMQGEAVLGPFVDETVVQYHGLPSRRYRKTYKVVEGKSAGKVFQSDPRLLHLKDVKYPSTADVLALHGIKTQKIRLI